MKGSILLGILVFCGSAAAAEMHQWVDENGKRHFSDRPLHSSQPVSLFDSKYQAQKIAKPTKSASTAKTQSSPPSRKQITADDYNISVKVGQQQNMVILSGRISEGPPCKRLKIDFYLQDGEGRLIHLIDIAENLGGFLSDLLEASKKVKYGDSFSRWDIVSMAATCQQMY
ncbi:MAG: DUF4124 domain-containing protein [Desulfuromonadales bacterium]